ncbi:hypothetical protein Dsin_003417 [Dipteronia sinensis]|uniref:SWIM-type domain-containing protein n=1 Tax=Dipteronia sinensis TaxID=43782 RepID=A0AAE0B7M4_9ROSI|nr:hypothetical protein Dsin_003417 [Dipteronia sinensis]
MKSRDREGSLSGLHSVCVPTTPQGFYYFTEKKRKNDEKVGINTETKELTVTEENIASLENVEEEISATNLALFDDNMADFGDGEDVDANDIFVEEMFSYVEVDGNTDLFEIEEDVDVESGGDSDGYLEGYRSNNDELFGNENSEDGDLVQRMEHFKEVLQDYVIQEGFRMDKVKNEITKLASTCAYIGCSWRIHASLLADEVSFQIKTYEKEHLCQKVLQNFEASTSWIIRKLGDMIRRNPGILIDVLEDELRTKYQVEVHKHKFYSAKQATLGSLKEDHARCYGPLDAMPIIFMSDRQKGLVNAIDTYWPRASIRHCTRHIFANFKMHGTLEKLRQEGRSMKLLFANDFEFEILDEFGRKWVVDFKYYTCGCGAWQLSGLPCKHAMASLSHKSENKTGRPKVKRSVSSKVVRSTRCRGLGHNIRGGMQTQHAMDKDPNLNHNVEAMNNIFESC